MISRKVRHGLVVVLTSGILGVLPLSLAGCDSGSPDGDSVVPKTTPKDVMKDSMNEMLKHQAKTKR